MKFYMAEKEAMDFLSGYHTLKEWANFGFNKVRYNGEWFYDGCHGSDGKRITDEEDKEAGLLKWAERDWDEDGYMYVVLERVGKEY